MQRASLTFLIASFGVAGCGGAETADSGAESGWTTGDLSTSAGDGTSSGDGDGTTSGDGDTTSGDGDTTSGDGDGTTSGDGDDTTSGDGDGDGAASVCARWLADTADVSEGSWSGAVAGCDPGDMDAPWRDRALRMVNLQRFVAGLPEVALDATKNMQAQECSLMMDANGALDHAPPMSWTCWSSDGDTAAGRSNISPTAGVTSVGLYMDDPGNSTTIGHRRWILSNSLGPIGIGSTDTYSCLYVLYGSGDAGAAWAAWPSPGSFPIQAISQSWSSVDDNGWTVQSDDVDFTGANVTVTVGATAMPVTVTQLLPGYGSSDAISFIPQGWASQAGTTYHVEVTGIASPIAYDVEMVDCQ